MPDIDDIWDDEEDRAMWSKRADDQPKKPITPCGGCGAIEPRERCIGCMHVFHEGDWPSQYRATPTA